MLGGADCILLNTKVRCIILSEGVQIIAVYALWRLHRAKNLLV